MKLLENYIKAVEELEEYFGIDNLNYYSLEINNSYFSSYDDDAIGWAETEEDLKNEYGEFYISDIRQLIVKEELTLVLIENNNGGDDYWIIFHTDNERS